MPAIEPDAALRAVNIGVAPKTHDYQFTFLFLRGDKRPEFPFVRHISTGDLQSLLRRSRDFWTRATITAYAEKDNRLQTDMAATPYRAPRNLISGVNAFVWERRSRCARGSRGSWPVNPLN
jgi:hypothetical protein